MNCDICNYNTSLICSNCMNQAILKCKIQEIGTSHEAGKYVKEIDGILANCINHNSYIYIKAHSNDKDPDKSLTAKLAQQLLNIEIVQLKKSLLTFKDKIDKLTQQNSALRRKVEERRLQNNALRKVLNNRISDITRVYNAQKVDLNSVKSKEMVANRQTAKQLTALQSKCSQELTSLHNIMKNSQVYISFVPIVPISTYINYSYEIVNANLLNISNYLVQSSNYFLTPLAFSVFFPTEVVASKISLKHKHFQFLGYNPTIRNRNECYPLYLTKNLYELSKYELSTFVKALSCLILNVVIMIQNRNFAIDLSLNNLVNLGGLIWKLISNESSTIKDRSFLGIFWSLQKYKDYVQKVDMNISVTNINNFKGFKPSKTINSILINPENLYSQLFKSLSSDIQAFRLDNKEIFGTVDGKTDLWEVI